MTLFSQWELELLSAILSSYEGADFNCGASEDELIEVSCLKAGNNNIHLDIACGNCKYYRRFANHIVRGGEHTQNAEGNFSSILVVGN
jgi:hypothetical protein